MKTRRHIDLPVRRPRTGSGPLWRRLADALAWEIEIGRLRDGSRVPSTRTLARELAVSRTTVACAYDELTSRGYLHARVGDGAYVARPEERATSAPLGRVRVTGCTPDATTLVLIT